VLALSVAAKQVPQVPATQTPEEAAENDYAALKNDKTLDVVVDVDCAGQPLQDALADISQKYQVHLVAAKGVGQQRVNLSIRQQKLYTVMYRLAGLLSHSPITPVGYHWKREELPPAPTTPVFRLYRDARSLSNERKALDAPRQTVGLMLREMRDAAQVPPEDRGKNGKYANSGLLFSPDYQLQRDVLTGLSDSEIDGLMRGGTVSLNPEQFKDRISTLRRLIEERNEGLAAEFRAQNRPVPPGLLSPQIEPPTLHLQPSDSDGENPIWSEMYGMEIDGMSTSPGGTLPGGTLIVGPYNTPDLINRRNRKLADDPDIDLTTQLSDEKQAGDLRYILQAIAGAAHLNLYHEFFFKHSFYSGNVWGYKLPFLKAHLSEFLQQISSAWNCDYEIIGDTLSVWNNTWALDRQADIPEPLIQQWRAKIAATGGLSLRERVAIFHNFTWRQIRQTLWAALPEAGDWLPEIGLVKDIFFMRVMGAMTPEQSASLPEELRTEFQHEHPFLLELPPEKYGRILFRADTSPADAWLSNQPCESVKFALILDDKPLSRVTIPFPVSRPNQK
jgi:hypothetical protein